jgi:D-sedoheptulose 7-phosphate isomerase
VAGVNEDVRNILAVARETVAGLSATSIADLGTMIRRARVVYTVGNGGSAAHASHCACDLTKLAKRPTICLNDNMCTYSAGVNDDRVDVYKCMLERYGFGWSGEEHDLLLIFSVGGGSLERNVSVDLIRAAREARRAGGSVAVVCGRKGDVCAYAHHVVHIECPVHELITPVVESVMPLVWHALVAGPLKREEPVWR